jgi:hypothetical protein
MDLRRHPSKRDILDDGLGASHRISQRFPDGRQLADAKNVIGLNRPKDRHRRHQIV